MVHVQCRSEQCMNSAGRNSAKINITDRCPGIRRTAKEEDEIIFGFGVPNGQHLCRSASLLEMHSSFDGAVPASSSADTTHLVLFAKLHNDVFLVSKLSVKLVVGDKNNLKIKSKRRINRRFKLPSAWLS